MRQAAGFMGAVLMAWVATASTAWAGEVVLANGDVLHGQVTYEDGRVELEHPVLGKLSFQDAEFSKFTLDGRKTQDPVPCAPPAAATGSACGDVTEVAEIKKPKYERPWDFAIGFGISDDRGNTIKFGLNADVEAEYRWRRVNRLSARIRAFYEEAQHIQTEGVYFGKLLYERKLSPRGRFFGTWIVDRDDFADIQLRNAWFLGYGYDFIQRERTTLTVGIGAGAVVENRKSVASIESAALLAQAEYHHEFRSGDSFEAGYYIIPYLDYTERSPMRLELRYAHPLRDHLDITAGFLWDYVPDPPGDIVPYDTKVTFGIRWKP